MTRRYTNPESRVVFVQLWHVLPVTCVMCGKLYPAAPFSFDDALTVNFDSDPHGHSTGTDIAAMWMAGSVSCKPCAEMLAGSEAAQRIQRMIEGEDEDERSECRCGSEECPGYVTADDDIRDADEDDNQIPDPLDPDSYPPERK